MSTPGVVLDDLRGNCGGESLLNSANDLFCPVPNKGEGEDAAVVAIAATLSLVLCVRHQHGARGGEV